MRKMGFLALLVALLCGASPAMADSSTFVKLSAVTSFASTSGKGDCLSTTVSVTAWDIRLGSLSGPRVDDPGEFDSPPAIYVAISQANSCTGALLVSGSAVTPVTADEITSSGRKLSLMTIRGAFSLWNEVDGTTLPVTLRVTLVGTGTPTEVTGEPSDTPLPPGTNEFISSLERSADGSATLTIGGKRVMTVRVSTATLYLATSRVWY